MAKRQVFHFVMIKPTHYDDDGYPIRFLRSLIPSNTLAAINGLMMDADERSILGDDVEIRSVIMDETNTRIRPERIIRDIRRSGGRALIGLIGVQTNQFPRAVDLAKPFLEAGLPVCIGGFHVSGCMSMLPELPPDIVAAQDMGISIFCGEAEERRLDIVIKDAWDGALKPVYNYMNALPNLQNEPQPFLERKIVGRVHNDFTSFDLGRGCPYQCSFCTIINVQGRKSRFRSADDLEAIIRRNAAQGLRKFFVTDDDMARNKHWEEFFDRLIMLKETEGLSIDLIIQVDTQCHTIPGFIEKACKAGVGRIFLGLENINPDNLIAVGKRHNKITEYRTMLLEWRKYGTTLYAGYIIGFPNDTKESVLRDIEIIKRELPVDMLQFYCLTPLPGSADHKELTANGVWMDPDMNKYDICHRVAHHPKMTDAEWEEAYHAAWHSYYTPEHIETIGRRAVGQDVKGVNVDEVWEFCLSYLIERLHPLEAGIVRMKARRDRRPGLPLEPALLFYPKFAFETVVKSARYALGFYRGYRMHKRIHADPNKTSYSDLAMTPPAPEDFETFAMFTETSGSQAAVKRQKVLTGARETPNLRENT